MSYIKPICDCSNELILTIHEMNSMNFRISDKGKIVKTSVKNHKETYGQEFGCVKCGNTHDAKLDDKHRYVRGETTR